MSVRIYQPTYVIPELGELGRMPDGGITNIGGTISPTFTVDGKGLLFDDGSSTSGTPTANLTLQSIYNNSATPVVVNLVSGKDVIFNAGTSSFSISSTTGNVSITANLVVSGLINGVDLVTLASLVNSHLTSVPNRHQATEVSVNTVPLTSITGASVQAAIESIDSRLAVLANAAIGFHHVQATAASSWVITHNRGSERVHVTVWDDSNQVVYPDTVAIQDADTVTVAFNTPMTGRAVLMIY